MEGVDFRTEYECIPKLCSIIPKNLNVMALMATTSTSNKVIVQKLCIEEDKCVIRLYQFCVLLHEYGGSIFAKVIYKRKFVGVVRIT